MSGTNNNYMIGHFKGKYRLKCPIDMMTNDYPKTLKGENEDIDVYIPCRRCKDIQVSYFGHGILDCYIPSIKVGNTIIKEIYSKHINPNNVKVINNEDEKRKTITIIDDKLFNDELLSNKKIIFNVKMTSEVTFKFKVKDEELIMPHLKPLTNGSNISPFSKKNLPKGSYEIPEDDLKALDNIMSNNEISYLDIARITRNYIKTLVNKKNTMNKINAEMKLKKLKTREYIHNIGKWNDFIEYVNKELNKGEK